MADLDRFGPLPEPLKIDMRMADEMAGVLPHLRVVVNGLGVHFMNQTLQCLGIERFIRLGFFKHRLCSGGMLEHVASFSLSATLWANSIWERRSSICASSPSSWFRSHRAVSGLRRRRWSAQHGLEQNSLAVALFADPRVLRWLAAVVNHDLRAISACDRDVIDELNIKPFFVPLENCRESLGGLAGERVERNTAVMPLAGSLGQQRVAVRLVLILIERVRVA